MEMRGKKRVLIVEDHGLLRAGIRSLLAQDAELEVVGEADNGRDAVRATETLSPDMVLMDISMPGMNGIEALTDIKRRFPKVFVLVVTAHKADEYIHESLRAGADGYILKDATHEELNVAIHSVLGGKTYLSPDISKKVITAYLGSDKSATLTSAWDTLTHREREVLKLVAEGKTNKYIADYFCLSVKTIEKHRSNLMKKLDLHNAAMLTAYGIEKGLVVTS